MDSSDLFVVCIIVVSSCSFLLDISGACELVFLWSGGDIQETFACLATGNKKTIILFVIRQYQ